MPALEWSKTLGVFGVVELFVVEASFIDAWVLILCGCIDDSEKPVIKFVNDNDNFFGICLRVAFFIY